MRFISLFLFLLVPATIIWSQDQPPPAKSELGVTLGFNTFGPVGRMNRLMIDNDFNVTTANWFSGSDITHPRKDPVGFTAQISWFRPKTGKTSIGILLGHSYLREITGFSLVAEWLTVSFSSSYLAFPVYNYKLSGDHEGISFQAAPVVMISSGRETGTGISPEKYLRVSPGLLGGVLVSLWDNPYTSGRFGLQLMSGIPVKMGPFIAENYWEQSDEIPVARYWFSHLNLNFNIGFHL